MKKTFPTALCLLVCAVLVVFSFFYGAYRGWQGEYNRVQAIYAAEPGGLNLMLTYRANDAANLEKVCLRHLNKENAHLISLMAARDALIKPKATLTEKFRADMGLTSAVQKLADELYSLPSFLASERDMKYLVYIMQDMESLSSWGVKDEYNEAARDYNNRINRSASGLLARLMLLPQAEVFE